MIFHTKKEEQPTGSLLQPRPGPTRLGSEAHSECCQTQRPRSRCHGAEGACISNHPNIPKITMIRMYATPPRLTYLLYTNAYIYIHIYIYILSPPLGNWPRPNWPEQLGGGGNFRGSGPSGPAPKGGGAISYRTLSRRPRRGDNIIHMTWGTLDLFSFWHFHNLFTNFGFALVFRVIFEVHFYP